MIPKLDSTGVIISCPHCGKKNRLAFARLGETMRCGQCKQELKAPADPIEIPSAADFDRIVAQSSLPIVVDYWAPWCGPCRMVAPAVERVAHELAGHLKAVKVNVDESPAVAGRYQAKSIPTLVLLRDGQEIGRQIGALPADRLLAWARSTVTGAGAGKAGR